MIPPVVPTGYVVEHLISVRPESADQPEFSTCFFLADQPPVLEDLKESISGLVESGCISFVIWGEFSDMAENLIDSIIEDLGESYFAVTTASEKNDSIEEAINLFSNKKLWLGKSMGYYIVFPNESRQVSSVRMSILESLTA